MSSIPDRDDLLSTLRAYHDCVASGAVERKVDQFIDTLEAMVPHANISDLMFWGEKERTDEEVVDEALFRERLWQTEGELALLTHVYHQLASVAGDSSALALFRNYAERELVNVACKIERTKSGRIH